MHWYVALFTGFQNYLNVNSGQIYETLVQEREAKGVKDVVINRIEQIPPYPYDLLSYFFRFFNLSF